MQGGQLDGRAVTAAAVDVAPQRQVKPGQVGAREASRSGDGVLAHERHVVHAAQDATVSRHGQKNLRLLQVAERSRRQALAVQFPADASACRCGLSISARWPIRGGPASRCLACSYTVSMMWWTLVRAVPCASNGIPGRRIGDGAGDDRVREVLQRLESMAEVFGKALGELQFAPP